MLVESLRWEIKGAHSAFAILFLAKAKVHLGLGGGKLLVDSG